MKYVTNGFGDEATWPPCQGYPNDPRATDPEEVMLELPLDQAVVSVCAEWIGEEPVVTGVWLGDKWVDAAHFSSWQRAEWARLIEKDAR